MSEDSPSPTKSASLEGGIVKLKKRKKRGALREKRRENDEDDEEKDINIADKVADLKNDQSLRTKRQKVFSTLFDGGVMGKGRDDPVAERSMKEMIGSHFASNDNEVIGGTNLHEKLLETYIKEHMGHDERAEEQKVKQLTEEEKLYYVPEEIKKLEGRSENESALQSMEMKGQVLSLNTGISEVQLPETYKMTNITATEEAKRKKREDRLSLMELKKIQANQRTLCLGNTAVSRIRKQQQEDWKAHHIAAEKSKAGASSSKSEKPVTVHVALPGEKDTNHRYKKTNSQFERSTDDEALSKFCKNERRKFINRR